MFIGSKPKDLFPRQNKAAADFYRRQQQKKIHAQGPYLVQRSFRRNEGTTDYATIPEVTLSGSDGLVIDISVYEDGQSATNGAYISLHDTVSVETLSIGYDAGRWKIASNGRTAGNGSVITVNTLNRVQLFIDGLDLVLFVNGVEDYRVAPTGGVAWINTDFDRCEVYRNAQNQADRTSGILANLKIWGNGTLIRDYPLDDNSDDLRERVSGQNGTVINGNASDWGLFQQQVTGEWIGQELVVNGGFDTDSDWTKGVGWSIAGGSASVDATANFAQISQNIPISVGAVIRTRYSVLDYIVGSVLIKTNTGENGDTRNGNGDYMDEIIAASQNLQVITTSTITELSADNVSAKEVLNVA